MSYATLETRAALGLKAPLVRVEVHLARGLPRFSIVGLPEAAVKESKDRVRSAIENSFFEFPCSRITVNLAPADLPKEGGRYDLAIALGILIASNQLPAKDFSEIEIIGELALSGTLNPVSAALPTAIQTYAAKKTLLLPLENCPDLTPLRHLNVLAASSLLEIAAHFSGRKKIEPHIISQATPNPKLTLDIGDVTGQEHAKRALEIAAAGQHSLLLIGPPGTGKSMLAARLPSLLPPLTETQALEIAAIYSLKNKHSVIHSSQRPFRTPHHSASTVALVGGGSIPKPGEISLAHNGILFLDELPEFSRRVLESLREPLETHKVIISRAASQCEFPANFQFIAAMNPCPCGHAGNPIRDCRCSDAEIQRYRSKLSGPLLDRIDMHIDVPAIPAERLLEQNVTPQSADIQKRVIQARARQIERQGKPNHLLDNQAIKDHCKIDNNSKRFLYTIMEQYSFSARVYYRVLKLARTIADLNNTDKICQEDIEEALFLRVLDQRIQSAAITQY